jgi:hypothetical protein
MSQPSPKMKPHSRRFPLVLLMAAALGLPALAHAAAPRPTADPDFPIIGVAADSQITTTQGGYLAGLRDKAADRWVETAIRPLALELLAAPVLDYFLCRLTNVDVILYLGDAANSGCEDELRQLFEVLERRRTNNCLGWVPVFYVIGNHDYLGLGTTPDPSTRQTVCGPIPTPLPTTK